MPADNAEPAAPLRTADFDYHLPPQLIAQTPVEPRDAARLLVLPRNGGPPQHRRFADIADYLPPGCVLVLNRSRVLPARLYGRREPGGGRVELLLLRREAPGRWQALGKPGRRLRPGTILRLEPADTAAAPDSSPTGQIPEASEPPPAVTAEVVAAQADGVRIVQFSTEDGLEQLGQTPLPPYIHQPPADPERYQTVYARQPGSVAAPTAGLHFTPELLAKLQAQGIDTAFVTLHIGLDTFRPVSGDDPTAHTIHTEYYELPAETAARLTQARAEGRPIIAVGTTSVRTLEQVGQDRELAGLAAAAAPIAPARGQAELFILPGHPFRLVDGMITNFHLPRSTLLMLVSAFAGRARILAAYSDAIAQGYRFYSFGDAMLIL